MFTEATANDCEEVAQFAAKTFNETFGHLYEPANLMAHLLEKFSPEFFTRALEEGNSIVMMRDDAGQLIGYAKVGHLSLPVKKPERGAQEIHRVYIDREHQSKGYGKELMLHILSLPRIATAPVVYLGVWEENLRAQQLYTLYGFEPVGRYLYQVGTQTDREIIMARKR